MNTKTYIIIATKKHWLHPFVASETEMIAASEEQIRAKGATGVVRELLGWKGDFKAYAFNPVDFPTAIDPEEPVKEKN